MQLHPGIAYVFQKCPYVLMAVSTSGLLKIQSLTLPKQPLQRIVKISFPSSKNFYTPSNIYVMFMGQALYYIFNLFNL